MSCRHSEAVAIEIQGGGGMNIDAGRYWDKAWTLVDGCTPVSAGCANCWSAGMTHRFKQGLTDDKGRWTGEIIIRESRLALPFRTKKPTVWAVWNDLFHEKVPLDFISKIWMTMLSNNRHIYLVLTKRPHRMQEVANLLFRDLVTGKPAISTAEHIYLGTTVENQQTADERIPHLLQIEGKKFLSIEPMLEKIIIPQKRLKQFDQVIVGGETGQKARLLYPDWVRSVRDQCQTSGVPFFFKGFGEWVEVFSDDYRDSDLTFGLEGFMRRVGKRAAGRILDGRTHDDLAWSKN